jgi:dTDP-4-dehydrorhamnose 3,5-epimerase
MITSCGEHCTDKSGLQITHWRFAGFTHLCGFKFYINMPFLNTPIADLLVFEPQIWHDDRGYFFESYNRKTWDDKGISVDFVQDNQARSMQGVLRGLHYQTGSMAQAKLVRVVEGEVLDVAVDLRPESPSYGQWYSIRLSAENKRQLFVPRGFAHGYLVLSELAEFAYKCDNYYSKAHEGGLRYDDPHLNINWEFDLSLVLVSEKDFALPFFGSHRY